MANSFQTNAHTLTTFRKDSSRHPAYADSLYKATGGKPVTTTAIKQSTINAFNALTLGVDKFVAKMDLTSQLEAYYATLGVPAETVELEALTITADVLKDPKKAVKKYGEKPVKIVKQAAEKLTKKQAKKASQLYTDRTYSTSYGRGVGPYGAGSGTHTTWQTVFGQTTAWYPDDPSNPGSFGYGSPT